jgi:hypothetical protein
MAAPRPRSQGSAACTPLQRLAAHGLQGLRVAAGEVRSSSAARPGVSPYFGAGACTSKGRSGPIRAARSGAARPAGHAGIRGACPTGAARSGPSSFPPPPAATGTTADERAPTSQAARCYRRAMTRCRCDPKRTSGARRRPRFAARALAQLPAEARLHPSRFGPVDTARPLPRSADEAGPGKPASTRRTTPYEPRDARLSARGAGQDRVVRAMPTPADRGEADPAERMPGCGGLLPAPPSSLRKGGSVPAQPRHERQGPTAPPLGSPPPRPL